MARPPLMPRQHQVRSGVHQPAQLPRRSGKYPKNEAATWPPREYAPRPVKGALGSGGQRESGPGAWGNQIWAVPQSTSGAGLAIAITGRPNVELSLIRPFHSHALVINSHAFAKYPSLRGQKLQLMGARSHLMRTPTRHPHFESPQFRQVMQPSIITTAAVLHLVQSWAPCG